MEDDPGQDSRENEIDAAVAPEAPAAAVPAKPKGRSPWLWVGIGCGTLFVLAAVAIVLFVTLILKVTSGPVEVADAQLKALKNGEIRKAYDYCSIDFQNSVSFSRYKAFIDSNPSLRNNRTSTFNKRSIENNVATLSGTLTSEEGAVTPVEYRFVKEKGEWKILFMNLNPRPERPGEGERGVD